jgi:hypothetical protein
MRNPPPVFNQDKDLHMKITKVESGVLKELHMKITKVESGVLVEGIDEARVREALKSLQPKPEDVLVGTKWRVLPGKTLRCFQGIVDNALDSAAKVLLSSGNVIYVCASGIQFNNQRFIGCGIWRYITTDDAISANCEKA